MIGNSKEETQQPIYTKNPKGNIFPFYCLCRCFGKRKILQDGKYYDVFCNNFVYTTDGRMFVGNYIPGEDVYEDLDPVTMIPADYIFCCGFCCPDKFFGCLAKGFENWDETIIKDIETQEISTQIAPNTGVGKPETRSHRNYTRKKRREK